MQHKNIISQSLDAKILNLGQGFTKFLILAKFYYEKIQFKVISDIHFNLHY